MSGDRPADDLFARYVEQHVRTGERLKPEELCRDCPELLDALRRRIRQYEALEATLATPSTESLPEFEGFRTIERIGEGGSGAIYKLQDLELDRVVAAKVVRPDSPMSTTLDDFVREARSLALFDDPRIVRIHEFRRHSDPPVLLMEHVEGFRLDRIAGSLEYAQRARLMVEVCEAIQHAHSLGIQHRDLKPANILVGASLAPKILDFGLSRGEPDLGHWKGTLSYMAPEQFDPRNPIDDRSDIYALGVILYEVLCGVQPYRAGTQDERIAAILKGEAALPVEVDPDVPEPLQAITLKAMERDPDARYASALEMARDLRRFLEGRPVVARPSLYRTALGRRSRPHLEQIREWLRLKLIYPHEAERLTDAYRDLEIPDEDWIIRSRVLSFSQVSLYLGAFLLLCGGLLYFVAHVMGTVEGLLRPTLVLGLPFVSLNVAAGSVYRRGRPAVAVAFHLGAAVLLPLFLLIVFQEAGWWVVDPADELELLGEGWMSNRQLQLASLVACGWTLWLATSTRTVTLSGCFTLLALVFDVALLAEFGLRGWFEEGRWDLLSLHLVPSIVLAALLGFAAERSARNWLAQPLYLAAVALYGLALELLALDGKAFAHLGISMAPFQPEQVTDPALIDTLSAMTINGLLIYGAAWLLDRRGTGLMKTPAWLLFSISPFAILEPIAWLNFVGEYSLRYAWLYCGLALAITVLSHFRQRKSFYYAGLLNTGGALWYLTDLHDWWDRPAWAVAVIMVGLSVLAIGFALHVRERVRCE